ncbi:hypothetical protein SAMN05192576_0885 [Nocardioides szechwanensis]|uniref:Secreted protein n=1 Tax=Nocardioides szechwanensis TaxID=1005944 RepID=A0A1G9VXE7_9ACTN|nr:hypothetical protein [Nocardioides szechwanensis]SDM76616.1 hypothetical protein SAMN05192576_0885 [Nocardioides szechwanensis]
MRRYLTFANVCSLLALVIATSTGVSYAAVPAMFESVRLLLTTLAAASELSASSPAPMALSAISVAVRESLTISPPSTELSWSSLGRP